MMYFGCLYTNILCLYHTLTHHHCFSFIINDWYIFTGDKFRIEDKSRSFYDAKAKCQANGEILALADTEERYHLHLILLVIEHRWVH